MTALAHARHLLSVRGALTHGQAELQHVHGSFLLQEVDEAKEEVLLGSDLLQLQLQHLRADGNHQRASLKDRDGGEITHRRLPGAGLREFLQKRNQGRRRFCGCFRLQEDTQTI